MLCRQQSSALRYKHWQSLREKQINRIKQQIRKIYISQQQETQKKQDKYESHTQYKREIANKKGILSKICEFCSKNGSVEQFDDENLIVHYMRDYERYLCDDHQQQLINNALNLFIIESSSIHSILTQQTILQQMSVYKIKRLILYMLKVLTHPILQVQASTYTYTYTNPNPNPNINTNTSMNQHQIQLVHCYLLHQIVGGWFECRVQEFKYQHQYLQLAQICYKGLQLLYRLALAVLPHIIDSRLAPSSKHQYCNYSIVHSLLVSEYPQDKQIAYTAIIYIENYIKSTISTALYQNRETCMVYRNSIELLSSIKNMINKYIITSSCSNSTVQMIMLAVDAVANYVTIFHMLAPYFQHQSLNQNKHSICLQLNDLELWIQHIGTRIQKWQGNHECMDKLKQVDQMVKKWKQQQYGNMQQMEQQQIMVTQIQ